MAILVSGGAGYIGSHTCVELLLAGLGVAVSLIGWQAERDLAAMSQDHLRWQKRNPQG